nr:hypothetical protein [Tanacetum cinerariifolium]
SGNRGDEITMMVVVGAVGGDALVFDGCFKDPELKKIRTPYYEAIRKGVATFKMGRPIEIKFLLLSMVQINLKGLHFYEVRSVADMAAFVSEVVVAASTTHKCSSDGTFGGGNIIDVYQLENANKYASFSDVQLFGTILNVASRSESQKGKNICTSISTVCDSFVTDGEIQPYGRSSKLVDNGFFGSGSLGVSKVKELSSAKMLMPQTFLIQAPLLPIGLAKRESARKLHCNGKNSILEHSSSPSHGTTNVPVRSRATRVDGTCNISHF